MKNNGFRSSEPINRSTLNAKLNKPPDYRIRGQRVNNIRGETVITDSEVIYVKITEVATGPERYGWKEVLQNRDTGAWEDSYRTGTAAADPAYEINGADLAVGDTIYKAERSRASGVWMIEQGSGGSLTAMSNSIIMILGTFDQYKNCPGILGVAGDPPKDSSNNLCVPSYAWAEYAVCGYRMKKIRDMRSFPYWATGLNGQAASANRRFYNAYFGNPAGNCQGVRFLEYSAAGGVVCTCPTWLSAVSCFKLTAKFVATLTDVEGDSCPAQFYTDMAPYWGQTVTATICNDGGCSWSGTLGPFPILAYWREIPVESPRCFWGPDEFDYCNPCDSFGDLVVSVNKSKFSGGSSTNTYTGFYSILSAIKALVNNCASGPLTLDFGEKASSCPQVFEWLKIECCSTTEANNCTGTTPP